MKEETNSEPCVNPSVPCGKNLNRKERNEHAKSAKKNLANLYKTPLLSKAIRIAVKTLTGNSAMKKETNCEPCVNPCVPCGKNLNRKERKERAKSARKEETL